MGLISVTVSLFPYLIVSEIARLVFLYLVISISLSLLLSSFLLFPVSVGHLFLQSRTVELNLLALIPNIPVWNYNRTPCICLLQ